MANGYTGKILRVDLTDGTTAAEQHDDAFYRAYMGGRTLVAYYLLTETDPGTDPLGPENLAIFAPGVVTGANVSGNGRNGVGALSPLTGGFGNAEAGGYWGAELKRAGWDAVVVRGRASKPVYLWISEGNAELRDASHLWGKTVGETEDAIRDELADPLVRTCLIGPAGENMVRFACVVNDRSRFGGRTGIGAVMGSKNLKGIAVRAGRGQLPVADPAGVKSVQKWLTENLDLVHHFYDVGTAGGLKGLSTAGGLPTYNFQEGSFAGDDKITGTTMRDTILVKRDTCYACAVRCKRVVEVLEPHPAGTRVDRRYGGPEYETLSALGNNNGVDDLIKLAKASEQCAALGLDSISAGMAIGWALECAEKGLLTEAETGGLKLEWGNPDLVLDLLQKIAHRQGIGDLLAEGTARAARKLGRGSEQFALHVKGQEFPMHEPRIKHALGVGYALSPTGADHMHNMHDTGYMAENRGLKVQRQAWGIDFQPVSAHGLDDNKMELWFRQTHWRHFLDAVGMCHFLPYTPEHMVDLVRAATGWDVTKEELLQVGVRAATMARAVNLREGFEAEHDALPKRMYGPFRSDNSRTGKPLDPAEVQDAVRRMYRRLGWDERGVPTRDALEGLGIGWVHDAMQPTEATRGSKAELAIA
jgi:aldehyde:ferredoxin oxidoreductase